MLDLAYALAEEIGDPDLFVGRKAELTRLLGWAAGTKRRISLSTAILSRRKKGKTALLQRFFNILYTRGDPQLIPFYYRIPEDRLTKTTFADSFYRRVLSQYFAFTTRTPELVNQVLSLTSFASWPWPMSLSPPTSGVWRTSSREPRGWPGNMPAMPDTASRRPRTCVSSRSSTNSST
jgi:hypothetical protein